MSSTYSCPECGAEFERPYRPESKRGSRTQYCCHACDAAVRRRKADAALANRFWGNVEIGGADDCWPWTGRFGWAGYGAFDYRGRPHTASRMAYSLTNGGVPDDQAVCHSCDNPACCNPAHLWLGTQEDNMRDMASKGRWRNAAAQGRGQ